MITNWIEFNSINENLAKARSVRYVHTFPLIGDYQLNINFNLLNNHSHPQVVVVL